MPNTKYTLLRQASNATSLQEICQIAYEILGNPIFIEDRSSVKLAFTKNIKVEDPSWESDIVKGAKKASTQNDLINEMKNNYKQKK